MKQKSLLFILSLLVLATACGGSKSNGKRTTRITVEEIRAVMDNQVMECASINGGACPQGVSRLLTLNMRDADQSSVCSGFMVDKDTMVTNHHCIANMADCKNTYIAVYDGYGYHQTRCKSIVKTAEDFKSPNDSRRKIDFTVIKISDEFTGDTFSLSEDRAQPGESVTAWVVDHVGLDDETNPNLFESRITEFDCSVMKQKEVASLVLDNCPVIHGNSGSPAVNTAGEIIGVIWGATAADVSSQTDLDTRRSGNGLGLVTEMNAFAPYL